MFKKLLAKQVPSTVILAVTAIGIILAVWLGIYALVHQVAFGFDQARDAYEAMSIIKGDFKIIGPSSDVQGVFHGVLWYYLLAIPYAVFRDPQVVAVVFFIITFMTVPLAGFVAFKLFGRRDVALSTSLLYAFSPLFQAFTRWLSNPVYTLIVAPFFFLSLWRYIAKQTVKDAIVIGATIALIIQSDFAFGLLLILLPVYFLVFKLKVRFWDFVGFFSSLGIVSLSYVLAEIKFKGRATISMLDFISKSHNVIPIQEQILGFLTKAAELFSLSFFSMKPAIVGLLVIVLIAMLYFKRAKISRKPLIFSLIWLANIFIFLFFSAGFAKSSFVFAPSLLLFIATITYLFYTIFPRIVMIPLMIVIIFYQAVTTIGWVRSEFTPLSIQRGNTVAIEKEVIDYTYISSGSRPFTVAVVGNPLYIYTTWSFLYEYIGQDRYGFKPSLHGKDQAGYLGTLNPVKDKEGDLYLIIEPGPGIYPIFEEKEKTELDIYSNLIEEKKIGNFTVQKRKYKKN